MLICYIILWMCNEGWLKAKKRMKTRCFISISLVLVASLLSACAVPATQNPASVLPTVSTDRVEINYFYESDACFCLALATEWIDTVITTEYKAQLDSGELVYHRYDTKDPANNKVKAEFHAASYVFFITTTIGDERKTWPVGKIWMYTDTSGTNEDLKTKFVTELKRNIDKALAEAD